MKPLCCTVEEYWFWKWDPSIPREPPVDYQAPIRVWDNQFCVDADGDQCEIDRANGCCHQSDRAYEGIIATRQRSDFYERVAAMSISTADNRPKTTMQRRAVRQAQFLDLLRDGLSSEEAREIVGVNATTVRWWRHQFPDFATTMNEIEQP